jgi:hypothetical protein
VADIKSESLASFELECMAGFIGIRIVLPGDIVVRIDAQVDGAALRRVLDALRRR